MSRNLFGYILGFILFMVLIPALMYWVAGGVSPGRVKMIFFILMSAAGIGLSVWSIVYMKHTGKGNPMDAFNHEIAPRTSELMTEGPYSLCRNPMLLGVLIYYTGIIILLNSWRAVAVFAVFCIVMIVQVKKEEKRLEADFGEEYIKYKRNVKRLIPHIW